LSTQQAAANADAHTAASSAAELVAENETLRQLVSSLEAKYTALAKEIEDVRSAREQGAVTAREQLDHMREEMKQEVRSVRDDVE
jgi:uncharacterized coiled-coil DUF342 family protein